MIGLYHEHPLACSHRMSLRITWANRALAILCWSTSMRLFLMDRERPVWHCQPHLPDSMVPVQNAAARGELQNHHMVARQYQSFRVIAPTARQRLQGQGHSSVTGASCSQTRAVECFWHLPDRNIDAVIREPAGLCRCMMYVKRLAWKASLAAHNIPWLSCYSLSYFVFFHVPLIAPVGIQSDASVIHHYAMRSPGCRSTTVAICSVSQ